MENKISRIESFLNELKPRIEELETKIELLENIIIYLVSELTINQIDDLQRDYIEISNKQIKEGFNQILEDLI